MDAVSLLESIAGAFGKARLETVLIGNAAAALDGAPVTTDDFDFMFRPTRMNIQKMRSAARLLGATLSQPEYPISKFYRMMNEQEGLQVDMMGVVDGVRSFESLRSRSVEVIFGRASLLVADLRDVIRSKKIAGREKDRAVLPVLEKTLGLKGGLGR
jgi:hypothetical protein